MPVLEATHGGMIVELPRGRTSTSRCFPRTITTGTVMSMGEVLAPAAGGVWHAIADPWSQAILQRAFLEITLVGLDRRSAGVLDRLLRTVVQRRVARARLLPGLVVATLTGMPLLVGGAIGARSRRGRIALAGRIPGIGRDIAVAIAITSSSASACSWPCRRPLPRASGISVRRRARRDLRRPPVRRASVVVTGGALWLMHGPLLAVGFDRMIAAALGARPWPFVDAALLVSLIALAILVAVQGLGNLLALAVLIGPSSTARLPLPPDARDDGGPRRCSRSLPGHSAACTSPITRAWPRAPRSRR